MTPRRKKKKIDIFVVGVFTYIIVFVTVAWVTYWIKGDVPDALIEFGLGGGVIELALTAAIEITTNKRENK